MTICQQLEDFLILIVMPSAVLLSKIATSGLEQCVSVEGVSETQLPNLKRLRRVPFWVQIRLGPREMLAMQSSNSGRANLGLSRLPKSM